MIALVWNLRGGVDVTDALMPKEPASSGDVNSEWIHRVDRFDNRSRMIGFAIVAAPFVALLVYLLIVR